MSDELPKNDESLPPLKLDQDERAGDELSTPNYETNGDRRVVFGWVVLPWIVIILGTSAIVGLVAINMFIAPQEEVSDTQVIQQSFMGKYLLGANELFGFGADKNALESLNDGPLEQRWCYVALLNEFQGAEEAQNAMEEIESLASEHSVKYSDDQERLQKILYSVLNAYESLPNGDAIAIDIPRDDWLSGDITQDDQTFVKQKLAWYGELLLNPKQKPDSTDRDRLTARAQATFFLVFGSFAVALAMGIGGLVLLVVYLIALFQRKLRSRFRPNSMHGAVYAETFAIWFVLFFASSLGIGLLNISNLIIGGLISLLSLVALFWPVIRGIPVRQVREDIGLTFKNPFSDIAAALSVYLAMLPVLAVCLVFVFILSAIESQIQGSGEFAPTSGNGSHPIISEFMEAKNPWVVMLKVGFLTVIVAPIVEEIAFRGVLFRHLRDATSRWTLPASVIFSAVVNSFIFAAIHPQGIFGVPVLMPLAIGFSLVRQWRGSLIGPIIMHAVHNGMATFMMFLMIV